MWLAPEPPEPIIELQSVLLASSPDCNDVNLHAGGFRPHLSVGQARSPSELEERLDRIRTRFDPIHILAEEIAMIRRAGKDDPFEVDRLIPFGG